MAVLNIAPHPNLPADAQDESKETAATLAAYFRGHPHVNNVLTHISGGDWRKLELALRELLTPRADPGTIGSLAANLVELLAGSRGVSGRMLGPFFREVLTLELGEERATAMIGQVQALFDKLERQRIASPLIRSVHVGRTRRAR